MSERNQRSTSTDAWRVLCVDDDPAVLRVFTSMLRRAGCVVVGSASPLEALELLRTGAEPFDLLLTDQTMPELNGMALAARVLELVPDLPVVLVSGYAEEPADGIVPRNIRLRLQKPVLFQALSDAIRFVLSGPA